VALLLAACAPVAAQQLPFGERPLDQLTLEELLEVEVTSVSGLAVRQFSSPAAIYVITGEELRRSGLRTIPEALRLVPGMFVGRASASGWVTGARGLSGLGITASRYLVMVDGRVVFDPLISVALWDVVDVPVDQIDRIEVIRGPGATLWGVNAMNGVISVVTRGAGELAGGRAIVGAGTETRAFGSVRWGGESAGGTAYSAWAKYFEVDDFELVGGASARDQWSSLRGGIRADGAWKGGAGWTVEASAYELPELSTSTREPVPGEHLRFRQVTTDDDVSGGFLRLGAGRGAGTKDGWSVQGYFDSAERDTTRIGYRREFAALDWRRWRSWGDRQDLIWGVDLHRTSDRIRPGSNFVFDPGARDWWQWNGFVQNTSEIVPGRLFAMVGSKLTYHDFVGLEAQPGVRLWWTPDERQMAWTAVSRPVRVPSRLEENGMIVVAYADPGILSGGAPTGAVPFGVRGSEALDVEKLLAYEAGYRWHRGRWLASASVFYNDYATLIALPTGAIGSFSDAASGVSLGGELWVAAQLSDIWHAKVAWSALEVEIDGPVSHFEERAVPRRQAQLNSFLDVGRTLELDGALYWVDELPGQQIDEYLRLDLGVTWRPAPRWRLALRGQNLLDSAHREASAIEVPRGAYLALEIWF
jgi:iron complex outermembrane receptor protein